MFPLWVITITLCLMPLPCMDKVGLQRHDLLGRSVPGFPAIQQALPHKPGSLTQPWKPMLRLRRSAGRIRRSKNDKGYLFPTTTSTTTEGEITTNPTSAGPIVYPSTVLPTTANVEMPTTPPTTDSKGIVITFINETLCPREGDFYDCTGLNATDSRENLCFYFLERKTLNCEDARLAKLPKDVPLDVRMMNLSGNYILKINQQTFSSFHSLMFLDLSYGWLHHVDSNTFTYMNSLEHLHLQQHWSILQVGSQAFYQLPKLQSLSIGSIQDPDLITVFFDLKYSKLRRLRLHFINFLNIRKTTFEYLKQCPLTSLHILYGSINQIEAFAFSTMEDLEEILIQDARITSLHSSAFMNLKLLQTLTLQGSILPQIPPGLLDSLGNLQRLSLRGNMLQSLPGDMFKYNRNLQYIDLSLNHLQTLPEGLFNPFPASLYVNFTWNFFTCDCSLTWASSWVASLENQSVSEGFQCHNPLDLRGRLLQDFHPICIPWYVWYVIGAPLGSLVLGGIVALLYKSRWKIYYQWYLLLSKKRGVWEDHPRFAFDAFVAYSDRDFQWVLHELIPHLEDTAGLPSIRLCVSDRDWDLGSPILDNMESSVQCSRKTLCIITSHFLKSEWCKLEMSLAHMQLFSENRDALIFVFLEKIPSERLSQHQRLRKELCKKSCLDWPGAEPAAQRVFWEKLRSLILKPHSENSNASRF